MEREIKHYYRVILQNILRSNAKQDEVFAVLEGEVVYELLTGKRIYFASQESEFDVILFTEGKYKLIGVAMEECSVSEVSKFLKFITNAKKDTIIGNINNQEQSIVDSLNNLDFYESNYVKKVKKHTFLRNY